MDAAIAHARCMRIAWLKALIMTGEEIFRQKQSVVLYFLCFLDLVGTRNGHSLTKGDGLVGFEMGTHERAQVVTHTGTRMCAHNVDTREGEATASNLCK